MGLVAGHQFILLELQVISPSSWNKIKGGGGKAEPEEEVSRALCKHAVGINPVQEQDR